MTGSLGHLTSAYIKLHEDIREMCESCTASLESDSWKNESVTSAADYPNKLIVILKINAILMYYASQMFCLCSDAKSPKLKNDR